MTRSQHSFFRPNEPQNSKDMVLSLPEIRPCPRFVEPESRIRPGLSVPVLTPVSEKPPGGLSFADREAPFEQDK